MQFHAEYIPKPQGKKILHSDKLLLMGSCFTSQVGAKLAAHKWRVKENPHGILFNPVSIQQAIHRYCTGELYMAEVLFQHSELWASWDHHTRFSSPVKEEALSKINSEMEAAAAFLRQADWIIITLGSAFVYERKDAHIDGKPAVAANCHKMPADKFNHRLLKTQEVIESLNAIKKDVLAVNSTARFLYTISPVRHLREGFIENNRSKATLIQAVHEVCGDDVFYFPSYELVIDDLRDYRFYAEDMVHPNYAATNYVWEKFISTCTDTDTQALLVRINEINAAYNHKAFNPASAAHKNFLHQHLLKMENLENEYGYLNFEKESAYFKLPSI
ncbi:MAG: GSCFA domain-containing protein [Ferruginibacter sp.]